MEPKSQTVADVNIRRSADGSYWFALTWRGVTNPAVGPFRNQMDAAIAAQAAVKALEARRGG
nr:hypothetical protein [uncultured Gellertiella sp.]